MKRVRWMRRAGGAVRRGRNAAWAVALAVILLLFGATLSPLIADDVGATDPAPSASGLTSSPSMNLSTGAMVVRVVLALALVLGLLAGVVFLYRRASRGGHGVGAAAQIEIVAQRALGARASLAVVRVGSESLLIGVTPQQITALGALPADACARGHGRDGGAGHGLSADPCHVDRMARAAQSLPPAQPVVPFESALQGEIRRVRQDLSQALIARGAARREGA